MEQETIQGFRLSPQQKRLWLLHQSGHSSSYRVRCAVLIEGNLEIQILEQAISGVISTITT